LHKPVDLWLFIWPGLAVMLGASAILAWGLNKRAFQRKNPRG
jgi:tryptophan-rich sensory protein